MCLPSSLIAPQAVVLVLQLIPMLSYDKSLREHVKEPNSSWSMLHPMLYSLSFLSQRVEALTCLKCIAPDHSNAECALSTLELAQEPPHIQQIDVGRQAVGATLEAILVQRHANLTSNFTNLKSLLLLVVQQGSMPLLSQAVQSGAQVHPKDHHMVDCTAATS